MRIFFKKNSRVEFHCEYKLNIVKLNKEILSFLGDYKKIK